MEAQIDPEHQSYLRQRSAEALVKLGPVKFLEGLRIIKNGNDSHLSIDELADSLRKIGVDSDGFSKLTCIIYLGGGYFDKIQQWHYFVNLYAPNYNNLSPFAIESFSL